MDNISQPSDLLTYVIYRQDQACIQKLVLDSLHRMHQLVPCQFTETYIQKVVDSAVTLTMMKALFFLLLNIDMSMKVCMLYYPTHSNTKLLAKMVKCMISLSWIVVHSFRCVCCWVCNASDEDTLCMFESLCTRSGAFAVEYVLHLTKTPCVCLNHCALVQLRLLLSKGAAAHLSDLFCVGTYCKYARHQQGQTGQILCGSAATCCNRVVKKSARRCCYLRADH